MRTDFSLHPLLDPPVLEHGLPRFAEITDDLIRDVLPEAPCGHHDEIRGIADNVEDPPPGEHRRSPGILRTGAVPLHGLVLFTVPGTDSTEIRRKIAARVIPELSAHTRRWTPVSRRTPGSGRSPHPTGTRRIGTAIS